jgi:hypothetical protein
MNRYIKWFCANPDYLFLADGVGALLTVFGLTCVEFFFFDFFGVPAALFRGLQIAGIAFSVYSLCCYFYLKKKHSHFLRAIAIANFSYCVAVFVFLCINFDTVTSLAWLYFGIEIGIVLSLVSIEFRVARFLSV